MLSSAASRRRRRRAIENNKRQRNKTKTEMEENPKGSKQGLHKLINNLLPPPPQPAKSHLNAKETKSVISRLLSENCSASKTLQKRRINVINEENCGLLFCPSLSGSPAKKGLIKGNFKGS